MTIDAKKLRLMWQITAVVYLICVFVLTFGKFESTPDVPRFLLGIPMDKIAHFLMFIPLPIIAVYGLHRSNGKAGRFALFMLGTYIFGSILAAGIEIGQGFTTYRSYDILDFVADTLGLSLSVLGMVVIRSASQKW